MGSASQRILEESPVYAFIVYDPGEWVPKADLARNSDTSDGESRCQLILFESEP